MDANNTNVGAVDAKEKTLGTIERIAETCEKINSKLQVVEKKFETVDAIENKLQNVDETIKKNLAPVEAIKNKLQNVEEKIENKFETVDAIKKKMQAIEENTRARPAPMFWLSDEIKKEHQSKKEVLTRISVVAVGDIDPVKQKFSCEFYLSLRWNDVNIKKFIGKKDEIKWGENCWEPAIYFVDLENIETYERNETIPKERNDTQAEFYYHVKGTFNVDMDVQHFPFDYQRLTVTVTSHWDISEIEFIMDRKNNIRTWNFASKKEWDLQKYVLTEKKFTKKEYCDKKEDEETMSTSPNTYPLYKFKMYARRKYNFFLYNIALIMALITALTFSIHTVGADIPGERIQISLTLLLTSVALKYVVNGYIPQTPTPTVIDSHILASMVFQFFMAVQNGICGMMHSYKPHAVRMFEWWSFGILLMIFITIQVVFLSYWGSSFTKKGWCVVAVPEVM
eukprot:gene20420-22433_t